MREFVLADSALVRLEEGAAWRLAVDQAVLAEEILALGALDRVVGNIGTDLALEHGQENVLDLFICHRDSRPC